MKADDPHAHAEAILWLIENPDNAQAMGLAGREMVQTRFNWDRMIPRLLEIYNKVLSSRKT